jgi:Polyketide cyclase / dehydrase and lipid transport
MLRKILLIALVLLALVLLVGLALPTAYTVESRVQIAAPAARVHERVGDLRRWPEWTSWSEASPQMVIEYGAQTTGVGAMQRWKDDSGEGRLVFTRCDDTGIAYDMAFLMGDGELPSQGVLRYEAVDGGTQVVWTMKGDLAIPVLGGWMRLLLLGAMQSDFDKGLAKLKRVVEAT